MIKAFGLALAASVCLALPASAAAPGKATITIHTHRGQAGQVTLPKQASLELDTGQLRGRLGATGGVAVTDATGNLRYAVLLVNADGFPSPVSVPLVNRQPLERGTYTITLIGSLTSAVLRTAGLVRSVDVIAEHAGSARLSPLTATGTSPVWSDQLSVPGGRGIAVLLSGDRGPGPLSTQTMCVHRTAASTCSDPDGMGARDDMTGPAPGVATGHAHLAWNVFAENRLAPGSAVFDGVAGTGSTTHSVLWVALR